MSTTPEKPEKLMVALMLNLGDLETPAKTAAGPHSVAERSLASVLSSGTPGLPLGPHPEHSLLGSVLPSVSSVASSISSSASAPPFGGYAQPHVAPPHPIYYANQQPQFMPYGEYRGHGMAYPAGPHPLTHAHLAPEIYTGYAGMPSHVPQGHLQGMPGHPPHPHGPGQAPPNMGPNMGPSMGPAMGEGGPYMHMPNGHMGTPHYYLPPGPAPEAPKQRRFRRRYYQINRKYSCSFHGCTKSYGSLNHLNTHIVTKKHGARKSKADFKATDAAHAGHESDSRYYEQERRFRDPERRDGENYGQYPPPHLQDAAHGPYGPQMHIVHDQRDMREHRRNSASSPDHRTSQSNSVASISPPPSHTLSYPHAHVAASRNAYPSPGPPMPQMPQMPQMSQVPQIPQILQIPQIPQIQQMLSYGASLSPQPWVSSWQAQGLQGMGVSAPASGAGLLPGIPTHVPVASVTPAVPASTAETE